MQDPNEQPNGRVECNGVGMALCSSCDLHADCKPWLDMQVRIMDGLTGSEAATLGLGYFAGGRKPEA